MIPEWPCLASRSIVSTTFFDQKLKKLPFWIIDAMDMKINLIIIKEKLVNYKTT